MISYVKQEWDNTAVKLMEECGELTRALGKLYKHGRREDVMKNLSEECGDVMAMIDTLADQGLIDRSIQTSKYHSTKAKYGVSAGSEQ